MAARKAKPEMGFVEKLRKLHRTGLEGIGSINRPIPTTDRINSLDNRLKQIFKIVNNNRKPTQVLFFVMYDIENTKVRTQVAKYLIKKGCVRVQRSIFLADLEGRDYETIKSDLAEVQACYENEDSILIVPVSTDSIQAMKIIGVSIDIDLITRSKNTLFF